MIESGVVASWIAGRGFGFIAPDGGGKDIFCHVSELEGGRKSLAEGERVEYEIVKTPDGRVKATRVRLPS